MLGAEATYTGFLLYQEKKWNYSHPSRLTGRAYCTFFMDKLDLAIGVNYSEYLMGDNGWSGEVSRTFGETEIGLYFAKTNMDKFGGFRFKIPFPPQRRPRPGVIRLSTPYYYNWGYRATTRANTFGAPTQTGLAIATGSNLRNFQKNMVTSYIRNNIHVWKEPIDY